MQKAPYCQGLASELLRSQWPHSTCRQIDTPFLQLGPVSRILWIAVDKVDNLWLDSGLGVLFETHGGDVKARCIDGLAELSSRDITTVVDDGNCQTYTRIHEL